MSTRATKIVGIISSLIFVLFISPSANAGLYTFSQTGFSGGGTITGSFEAVDLDGNGQISWFQGVDPENAEVTNFSLSFVGDSIVGNFAHDYSHLFGLVYDVGSGFIGDGAGDNGSEGLASHWSPLGQPNGVSDFEYLSGPGPLLNTGGRVTNLLSSAVSSTDQLIVVVDPAPVPLPGAIWLFGTALMGFLGYSRSAKVRANS